LTAADKRCSDPLSALFDKALPALREMCGCPRKAVATPFDAR
jgi:hypothetical protein